MDRPATGTRERLYGIIQPVVDRLGLELLAIELYGGNTRRGVLRLTIDKVGGVGISECTRVSRAISPLLDVEDPIAAAYDLEVSSPGMERPLQREADFRRFIGCNAKVRVVGMDSRRWMKGALALDSEGGLAIQTAEGLKSFAAVEVERANLELTLEQFMRMGEGLPPIPSGEAP